VFRVLSGESLRVAVVGLGKMGLIHAGILNVMPNVELVALCEKSGMIRKYLKKIFNEIHIVDDVKKLADLDLDAVYVTTPIPTHFVVTKAIYSMEIARNLFVEKTLTSNYERSKELCDLANLFNGTNMVGYARRFSVTFMKVQELLTQEAIGKVLSFKIYARSSDFFIESEKASKARASRGGALRDLGCYAVDLALWFFGDLKVDLAKIKSLYDDNIEDSAIFIVRSLNGVEGEFDISWCVTNYRMPEVGLSIVGSKGIIEVNDDKLELKLKDGKSFSWHRHDLNDNVFFLLGAPEFYRENEHFVNSVTEGRKAEPSFEIASKVDKMIDDVKNWVY
jgi:predicted dehydrogenase